ncbi:MAG: hypothetical protein ABH843_03735 [Candidatus Omnitrophota bacterium]
MRLKKVFKRVYGHIRSNKALRKLIPASTLIKGWRLEAGADQRKSKPAIRGRIDSVFDAPPQSVGGSMIDFII